MARPQDTHSRSNDDGWIILLGLALVLGGALPAVLTAFGLRTWQRRNVGSTVHRVLLLGIAAYGGLCIYVLRDHYPDLLPLFGQLIKTRQFDDLPMFLAYSWFVTFPIAPILAMLLDLFLPKRAEDLMRERQRTEQQRVSTKRKTAQRKAEQAPLDARGQLVLGAISRGDLRDWQQGRWLCFPQDELRKHTVVVGEPGSGKTETLLRLAGLAAFVYGWQVIYLDAKGDRPTAARFMAAMQQVGLTNVPFFPTLTYDGWRGDARALLNRLHAVESYSDSYYAAAATQLLHLALNAPGDVPRNSDDFMRRLNLDALRDLYKQDEAAFKLQRLRPDDVRGAATRYGGFFDAIGGQLDGDWALEDVQAAYFLLDGTALKREAASLGRFLVEEIAHYVTARKPRDRQVLVIIDEFSALSMTADAANLFERLRSFGASVVVSSQSYEGLGPDAPKLLSAASTLIVHQSSAPQALVERAGTVQRIGYSYQVERGSTTGRGTLHEREQLRVDPNAVRHLGVGEAFVIHGGRAAQVQMAQLPTDADEGYEHLRSGGLRPPTWRYGHEPASVARIIDPLNPPWAATYPHPPAQQQEPPKQPVAVSPTKPTAVEPPTKPARDEGAKPTQVAADTTEPAEETQQPITTLPSEQPMNEAQQPRNRASLTKPKPDDVPPTAEDEPDPDDTERNF